MCVDPRGGVVFRALRMRVYCTWALIGKDWWTVVRSGRCRSGENEYRRRNTAECEWRLSASEATTSLLRGGRSTR